MRQQKAKTYTTEFKESSVKLAVDSDQSIAQIARDLGLKQSTLMGVYYSPDVSTTESQPK